jgi:hypothetical protein
MFQSRVVQRQTLRVAKPAKSVPDSRAGSNNWGNPLFCPGGVEGSGLDAVGKEGVEGREEERGNTSRDREQSETG